MTVVSPDTAEAHGTVNGTTYTWDTNNIPTNVQQLPEQRHRADPGQRRGLRPERHRRPDPVTGPIRSTTTSTTR